MIGAFREHSPYAIGLSGLLVKRAQQMVITAGDLREHQIRIPLLVGGAALSEKYTINKIAPAYGEAVCYAKDAMTGLALMNQLMDPVQRDAVLSVHTHAEAPVEIERPAEPVVPLTEIRSSKVRTDLPVPPA